MKSQKYFHPSNLFSPVPRSLPTPVPDAVLSPWVQNSFQQRFIKKITIPSPIIQPIFLLDKVYFYYTKTYFYFSSTKMYFHLTIYISISQNIFPSHKIYFYHTKMYFCRSTKYFHLTKYISITQNPSDHLPNCSCVSRLATKPLQSSGSPQSSGELEQMLQLHTGARYYDYMYILVPGKTITCTSPRYYNYTLVPNITITCMSARYCN